MTAGDNVRPVDGNAPGLWLVADPDATAGTGLILLPQAGALPSVRAGPAQAGRLEPRDVAALLQAVRPCALLPEHAEGWFGRPGLSGHRLDPGGHPTGVGEVLDLTGRHTAERIPQRHRLGDGLWLREGRRGHTGHDSATVVVAGVPGFSFGFGFGHGRPGRLPG